MRSRLFFDEEKSFDLGRISNLFFTFASPLSFTFRREIYILDRVVVVVAVIIIIVVVVVVIVVDVVVRGNSNNT